MKRMTVIIDEMVSHRVDVITDSGWFDELVDAKVKQRLEELMQPSMPGVNGNEDG